MNSQTPVLVVEILSPSTRGEDTLRKSTEYLAAGIGQYWIVDRAHRTLTVLAAGSGGWDVLRDLDDEHPTGLVGVGAESGRGTVELDLDHLLAV